MLRLRSALNRGNQSDLGACAASPATSRASARLVPPTDSNDNGDTKMKFNSTLLVAALTALTFMAPACDKKEDKKEDKKAEKKDEAKKE